MNVRDFRLVGTLLGKSRSLGVVLIGLVLLILLVGVLLVAFWPRHKIYSLDIATEITSLVITDPRYSEWDLAGATIYLDPFDDRALHAELEEYSFLQLNAGVSVELQRHGNGPLRIKLELEEGSIGRIDKADGSSLQLGPWAVITLPLANKPLLLPFRGYLSIGDDVTSQVDSILLNGRVSMVEEKLFTRGHYTAGEGILDAGDRVQLWSRQPESGKQPVASRLDGFIRLEPQSSYSEPMRLVAHGQADYARVERFGSAGYEIRTQAWVRFVNDPVLGVLFATLASLALLLEIFFKLLELRKTLGEATAEAEKGDDDD